MWHHKKIKPKKLNDNKLVKLHALANVVKQTKFNGHRFTAYAQKDGTLKCWESSGTIRPELEMSIKRPKIVEYDWYKKLQQIPSMSSVDGELYVPGGNAGDATHAIAECLPELEFMPFAVPWWDGVDCSLTTIKSVNNNMWTVWQRELRLRYDLPFATTYELHPHETLESLCYDAVSLSIEGWVLKESNYSGWWKVKPQKEIDCVVTGFKEGAGKYLGGVGSLRVSVWIDGKLTEIGSVSGMEDSVRWSINEEKDLGRVCEVEYQEIGNGGRFIHGHFVRWRDDKTAEDCVVERSEL